MGSARDLTPLDPGLTLLLEARTGKTKGLYEGAFGVAMIGISADKDLVPAPARCGSRRRRARTKKWHLIWMAGVQST